MILANFKLFLLSVSLSVNQQLFRRLINCINGNWKNTFCLNNCFIFCYLILNKYVSCVCLAI